jgi:hypothetical protein
MMVGVLVVGAAVAGVWGWQIKNTFTRFAAERAEQPATDMIADIRDRIETPQPAAIVQDSVDALELITNELETRQEVKQEVLDQVKAELQAELGGQVAGETTEVPTLIDTSITPTTPEIPEVN